MKSYLKLLAGVFLVVQFIACGSNPQKSAQNKTSLADTLTNIWQLAPEIQGISRKVTEPHTDHFEFSGLKVSALITYGSDENGKLVLKKKVVWPMLRTVPNDTHASLIHDFDESVNSTIKVDGETIKAEKPFQIEFNGILTIQSHTAQAVDIERVLLPSTDKPVVVEQLTISNTSKKDVEITVEKLDYLHKTKEKKGVYGVYDIRAYNLGFGKKILKSGEKYTFSQIYIATKKGEEFEINVAQETEQRKSFLQSLNKALVLETPDANLNRMFSFAKIRATESIYATKGGLMHGPGGGSYYAAIWANDQAEYVNPFFPFEGNANGVESAINSFRHFARFMNDKFEPIPSSIIAEGTDIWNGAGDRGDAAMIAYGASRFALAYGDKTTADSLLPLIKWCLAYCEHKKTPEGVIASDTDELEGRFPTGDVNLSTNMLAYGGYISAAHLLNSLEQEPELAKSYEQKAAELRKAVDKYFGANVQGFDTYQYFKGNVKLRSWICIPLTMGVYDRKDETLKALLSDKLWNENGIYTEAGDKTFWDRATLYAFRGIFKAGETDLAMKYFKFYSQKRLLGEHVPYAVEAYPEGGQQHLSAESGLYARVVTEGLFGIEPTGLNTFVCKPNLPTGWDYMRLKNIKAFKSDFDIEVNRSGNEMEVTIRNEGKIVQQTKWDGKSEIKVVL
jgi:hypothetical protein